MIESQPAENMVPRDVSIPLERAGRLAARLLPVVALVGLAPLAALWGLAEVGRGFRTVFTLWYFIPGLAATIILHEGLHAAGFLMFGRVPHGTVHFGVDRATLSPYAGCRVPMSARAYRAAVLLPALVLGLGTLIPGWILGVGWLAVLGTLQLITAGGDLVAYWAIRDIPAGARVLDHPERVGCQILDG
jgi:hypothetical protein